MRKINRFIVLAVVVLTSTAVFAQFTSNRQRYKQALDGFQFKHNNFGFGISTAVLNADWDSFDLSWAEVEAQKPNSVVYRGSLLSDVSFNFAYRYRFTERLALTAKLIYNIRKVEFDIDYIAADETAPACYGEIETALLHAV